MSDDCLLSPSELPLGFRFAAVCAGIKASGKADFAVAVTDRPAAAAAMFTGNRVVAAPVVIGRRHLERSGGLVRVIAVNSGNANCATGAAGLAIAEQLCSAAAARFGCPGHQVLPSSTGIIGVPLPGEKLIAALPAVDEALAGDANHFSDFARAILTTDTRPKVAVAAVSAGSRIDKQTGKQAGNQVVRLAGCAKGAGMIHPQLRPHATMLVYLFTDAAIAPAALTGMLEPACEQSFNRISIDGDTSTNDTVLLLASGGSGVSQDAASPAFLVQFRAALDSLCGSLAYQIVDDGEGVTHVVTLEIEGAPNDADALTIARAIAHSPLVKTAWAGNDPNWGRLLSTIGAAGVPIDPEKIEIRFGDLPICAGGERASAYDEQAAHAYLAQRHFTVHIALGVGAGRCRFWTTDLTAEYVHINADYSS